MTLSISFPSHSCPCFYLSETLSERQSLTKHVVTTKRKYATRTAAGVAATCAVLYTSKMMERKGFYHQPGDQYVLTHDNTKGELGDVMRLRVRNGQVM